MKNELISVIIPVYNAEKYIYFCVNSILNQSYKNLEIILIDDGSIDESRNICLDLCLKYTNVKYYGQENLGPASARNLGIELAKGEFISFIDSDDIISKNYIQNLYNAIIKYNVKISISKSIKIDENEIEHYTFSENIPDVYKFRKEQVIKDVLNQKLGIEPWGKLYSSSCFKNIKYPIGKYYEDLPTTCKILDKSEYIAVIDSIDYAYVQRSTSIINQKFNTKKLDNLEMANELEVFILDKFPNLKSNLHSKLFSNYSNVYMQVPNEEKAIRKMFWKQIKKHRKYLILSSDIRRTAKIGAFLSYTGQHVYKKIYTYTRGRKL